MPKFSELSARQLGTCHPDLVRLFERVVDGFDCTIIEGHRDKERQDAAVAAGRSQVRWPNGKHNPMPSHAVDAAPYPLDWQDFPRFYLFAGYVLGMAKALGIALRWGGDWDRDTDLRDQRFNDLVHFELADPAPVPTTNGATA